MDFSIHFKKEERIHQMDINSIFKNIKKNKNRKRCYHPLSDNSCVKFIRAHSIQKSKELRSIAKNGKVVFIKPVLSANGADIKVKDDEGIGVVSTFYGFCKKHDNELFKPIDTNDLEPTEEQAFLYSYRSICKEIFEKENGTNILYDLLEKTDDFVKKDFAKSMLIENVIGFDNLMNYKEQFDKIYLEKDYQQVKYYLIEFKSSPIIQVSGLLFPDFDFYAKELQNILQSPSLLTFCSAKTKNGWGVIFSWLEVNNNICLSFMKSLENRVYEGENLTNLLFNFLIQSSENLVFSPDWWNSITENSKTSIIDIIQIRNSPFISVKADRYKNVDITIDDWKFDRIVTNI